MNILNHGTWSIYKPEKLKEGLPPTVLFARRADGTDWYDYVMNKTSFRDETIKMIVHDGVVGNATRDATRLWPGNNATVLEITDSVDGDPIALFTNKLYDPFTGEFHVKPPPEPRADPLEELRARVAALEAKG